MKTRFIWLRRYRLEISSNLLSCVTDWNPFLAHLAPCLIFPLLTSLPSEFIAFLYHSDHLNQIHHVLRDLKEASWKRRTGLWTGLWTFFKGRTIIFLEGRGWKISLCKLFFLSMHLCKQFFSNNTFLQTIFFSIFFNHDLTQKGGSLLLPSIIISFNILWWRPINTSELIFFAFWDVHYEDWRQ